MITICRFVITSRHGSPLSEGSQNADFGKIDFVHAISCRYFPTRERSIHHNFIQEKNQFVISPKKQSDKLHLTVHNRRVLILSDKMHKGDGGINTVWTTFSSFARKLSFFGSSSLIGI